MTYDSDMDLFFEDGLDAVWTRESGDVPFKAYFDNRKTDPSEQGVSISGFDIVLTCPSAKVEGITKDNQITVGGKAYRVMRETPDGTGVSQITLQEA